MRSNPELSTETITVSNIHKITAIKGNTVFPIYTTAQQTTQVRQLIIGYLKTING